MWIGDRETIDSGYIWQIVMPTIWAFANILEIN